ncbi:MAG: hypothetical protein KKD00_07015 [Gammaproteobacteria bacterium]|nr:hypothetical protein [Gammaproteobacteria bacterium]
MNNSIAIPDSDQTTCQAADDPSPACTPICMEIPADNDSLIAAITRLAGHINAAQHRFLKLLAALIEREAWGDGGGIKSPSPAVPSVIPKCPSWHRPAC